MSWDIIATPGNIAWRQLLYCLSGIVIGYAWVLFATVPTGAWFNLGFGFSYLVFGLLILKYWPYSQWVKLGLLLMFLAWQLLNFHGSQPLAPIWVAPLVLLFCLSFEIGFILLSFFALALIALSSWSIEWPVPLYTWFFISLCLLMAILASHRNQWRIALMPLLHFNIDQNIYYASYLNAYLDREIHRCEREGAGLVVTALRFSHREKLQTSSAKDESFYTRLQKGLRPFDGLFTYHQGLILVLPYFTAQEALSYCQSILGKNQVQAHIGISRYNLDQNPSHLIEKAWQASKVAEDQKLEWVFDDDQS
jgi:hypothetical protein